MFIFFQTGPGAFEASAGISSKGYVAEVELAQLRKEVALLTKVGVATGSARGLLSAGSAGLARKPRGPSTVLAALGAFARAMSCT